MDSTALYVQMGRISVSAGNIELNMFVILQRLLAAELSRAMQAFAGQAFNQVNRMVWDVVNSERRTGSDQFGEEWDRGLKAAASFMDERNAVAHSTIIVVNDAVHGLSEPGLRPWARVGKRGGADESFTAESLELMALHGEDAARGLSSLAVTLLPQE